MAHQFYKGEVLIIAAADFEKDRGEWVPIASISWDSGRGLHFLTNLSERFASAEEAVSFGLRQAQLWTDSRLERLFKKSA
jgi:hypothetical protein